MKKNGKLITIKDDGSHINHVELLEELHGAVLSQIVKLIKSGEASSQDYSNAIKMLKDNGVTTVLEMNEKKTETIQDLIGNLQMNMDKEEDSVIELNDLNISKRFNDEE
jgi:CRISPR/Cas system-associated protein endoribonuclease Cas2